MLNQTLPEADPAPGTPFLQRARGETAILLRLAWPMMVAQASRMGLNVIDAVMVGQASTQELANLGMGRALNWVAVIAGIGLMSGITVFTSRAVGAGDLRRCGDIMRQGLLYAAVLGAVLTALVLLLARPALTLAGVAPDLADGGVAFSAMITLGYIPTMVGSAAYFFLQGIGRPKPGMIIITAALPLNVLLNWVFIYGNLGAPAMGATGAALATTLAVTLTTVIVLLYLRWMPDADRYGVLDTGWRRAWREGRALRRFGFAPGLATMLDLLGLNILAVWAGRFGAPAAAAFQILLSVHLIVLIVGMSLAMAASVRVGNAYGAQAWREIGLRAWLATGLTIMAMAVLVVLIYPNLPLAILPFKPDAATATEALAQLRAFIPFMLFDGVAFVLMMSLRASGDQMMASVLQIVGYLGVAVAAAAILVVGFGLGGVGLALAFGIAMLFTALAMAWRFQIVAARLARRS
ncbi:MAG: hypothetical protein C0521_16705 [Xanthomonas sp.]|nr:hypothetical protein [Xanthomonas sp.]